MPRAVGRVAVLALISMASVGYALWETPSSEAREADLRVAGALSTTSSPLFLVFVICSIWLTYCLLDTRRTRRIPRLARLGSYIMLLKGVALRALWLAILLAGVVSASSALAAQLGSSLLGMGSDAMRRITAAGLPLSVALPAQIALVCCFLIALRLAVEVLAMTFSYGAAVAAGIVIWVWGALSVNGAIPLGPLAQIETYTTIGQLARLPDLIVPVCVTYVLVFAALALSTVAADRSARQRPLEPPEWLAPCLGAFVCSRLTVWERRRSTCSRTP